MTIIRGVLCFSIALVACGPARRGDDGNGDGGSHGDAGCTSNKCSADLHDVIDCGGNVVRTCRVGLGCANGSCVDACQSAATSTSSVGCDYYAVNPDSYLTTNGSCFAVYLANTWNGPVSINVERAGQQLPVDTFARVPTGQGVTLSYAPLTNGMLMPNQVAILFLADHQGILTTPCPSGITAAYKTADAAVHGTAMGQAFHITTTAPVVAYDIFPYGGGNSAVTSATLLLPTSVWDTNYVAVDAFQQSQIAGQPFVEIVAEHDATTVMIRPTSAIVAGSGIAGAPRVRSRRIRSQKAAR